MMQTWMLWEISQGAWGDCLADQVLSEAGRQWKNPDAFDGDRAGMRGIVFPAATRIAKVLPVDTTSKYFVLSLLYGNDVLDNAK